MTPTVKVIEHFFFVAEPNTLAYFMVLAGMERKSFYHYDIFCQCYKAFFYETNTLACFMMNASIREKKFSSQ